MSKPRCDNCGKETTEKVFCSFRFCLECKAEQDRHGMIEDGDNSLYLTNDCTHLFVGLLTFKVLKLQYGEKTAYFGRRLAVSFVGPDGRLWVGTGKEFSRLLSCRRYDLPPKHKRV